MWYGPLTKNTHDNIQQATRDIIEISENAGRFYAFQAKVLTEFEAGRITQQKALKLIVPGAP